MVQQPRGRSQDNIVGDLDQYDRRPLNLCREKAITMGLREIIALCAFRAEERGMSVHATSKLPGVKSPILWSIMSGDNKDLTSSKLLALIDGLGMEVVLRPKPVPLTRQTRPEMLKSTQLAKAAKAANAAAKRAEPQPEPVATQPVDPEPPVLPEDLPQEIKAEVFEAGIITPEMRRDIQKMMAS